MQSDCFSLLSILNCACITQIQTKVMHVAMGTWSVTETAIRAKPRKMKLQAGQEKLIQRTMDKPQTWKHSAMFMAHYQQWQCCAESSRFTLCRQQSTRNLRMLPRCWASWLNHVLEFKCIKECFLFQFWQWSVCCHHAICEQQ